MKKLVCLAMKSIISDLSHFCIKFAFALWIQTIRNVPIGWKEKSIVFNSFFVMFTSKTFLFNYHDHVGGQIKEEIFMAFFNSVVTVLQTLVIALGAGLGIWGETD